MKIVDALQTAPEGAVLADEADGVVRLWTLSRSFGHGSTRRALARWFPSLEVRGGIIRLGGFATLAEAHGVLADAKMGTTSKVVQGLFRYDVPESLATIRHIA